MTSRDVARVAGVSQATVSRVMQHSERVSDETRQRVLLAMEEVGYVPNAAARTMKTRRTGKIGVVVASVTNPFYPEVIEALSRAFTEADQRMVLWNSPDPEDVTALQALREGMVDGIVFTTVTSQSKTLHEALSRGAPVVLVNRGVPGLLCDQVTSDNIGGSRSVAEYFVRNGHRRIGLIAGPRLPSTAEERERGFREGLADLDHPLDERLRRSGDFTHEAGRRAIGELMALDQPPTAVFCANDLTAFGALDGARALGLRVPEDLWLAGYDDVAMAAWDAFGLTTVHQPIGEMVRLAVDLLLNRIADPALPPQEHRFPCRLVVRRSTADAAC